MTRTLRVRSLAIVALSLYGVSLPARPCMPPTVQQEDPYHYMLSLADALSYAKSALDRTAGADGTAFQLLLGLKLGKADFDCAKSQVVPYGTSSNEAIQTSARGTAMVFTLLSDLNEKSVAEAKAVLDSAGEGKLKPGTVLERQAELGASYDEAWKLLVTGVIAGTYAVVEADPSTGLMSGLALTAVERDEVLRRLRSTFGEEVTKGMKAGQLPLLAAASALYQVVGDPKRRARASK